MRRLAILSACLASACFVNVPTSDDGLFACRADSDDCAAGYTCAQDGFCRKNDQGTNPKCGDSVIGPGEQCDGQSLGGKTCGDVVSGTTGTLKCTSDCHFDTTACAVSQACNNGTLDPAEACDPTATTPFPAGKNCQSVTSSYSDGRLICNTNCTIDSSKCHKCGNGQIEGDEECDGAQLNAQSCSSQGAGTGTLACSADCLSFDLAGCNGCSVASCQTTSKVCVPVVSTGKGQCEPPCASDPDCGADAACVATYDIGGGATKACKSCTASCGAHFQCTTGGTAVQYYSASPSCVPTWYEVDGSANPATPFTVNVPTNPSLAIDPSTGQLIVAWSDGGAPGPYYVRSASTLATSVDTWDPHSGGFPGIGWQSQQPSAPKVAAAAGFRSVAFSVRWLSGADIEQDVFEGDSVDGVNWTDHPGPVTSLTGMGGLSTTYNAQQIAPPGSYEVNPAVAAPSFGAPVVAWQVTDPASSSPLSLVLQAGTTAGWQALGTHDTGTANQRPALAWSTAANATGFLAYNRWSAAGFVDVVVEDSTDNGTNWGNTQTLAGNIPDSASAGPAIAVSGTVAAVAYFNLSQTPAALKVHTTESGTWSAIPDVPLGSQPVAATPSIAVKRNGSPIVAWLGMPVGDSRTKVRVAMYDNGVWVGIAGSNGDVGITPEVGAAFNPSLAVGPDPTRSGAERLCVAWEFVPASGTGAVLLRCAPL